VHRATVANRRAGLAFLSKCEAFFLFNFLRTHVGVCLYLHWKHFCEKNDGEGMALKVLSTPEGPGFGAFRKNLRTKFFKSLIFKS
jgi:hypothetical protein